MTQNLLVRRSIKKRGGKSFKAAFWAIFAGVIIGLIATLILKYLGGRFF